jgi:hypothetical protein
MYEIDNEESDKFDLYIDSELKLNQLPLRNPAKYVNKISFYHTYLIQQCILMMLINKITERARSRII